MSFSAVARHGWVNTFQTVLFLIFGAVALVVIGVGMWGLQNAANKCSLPPLWRR